MANIEKRPISDLITIVDNYYNTHSIPNNVSRKEEIKVLNSQIQAARDIQDYNLIRELENQKKKWN